MLLKFASCLCGYYHACYINCNAAVFPSKAVRSYASNIFCHMHAVRTSQQRPATTHFFKETVPGD